MTFLDSIVLVVAIAFLAVLAVLSSKMENGDSQDSGMTEEEATAYVDALNEWNQQLSEMENARRQLLMNEFALVVWTSIGTSEVHDAKNRTKLVQLSDGCDMLTITTPFGLVIRASFQWGKRRTTIRTEARFLGVLPNSGVGCSMFLSKKFHGDYVSIPSKKIFKWMSKVSLALVKEISHLGVDFSKIDMEDSDEDKSGSEDAETEENETETK